MHISPVPGAPRAYVNASMVTQIVDCSDSTMIILADGKEVLDARAFDAVVSSWKTETALESQRRG